MESVTDATWQTEVIQSDEPVVVEFWAPWCGPCRKVAPILEELDRNSPDITFLKCNSDENPKVTLDYSVMSIPYILVIENGNVVGEMVGAYPKSKIVDMINKALDGEI